MIRMRSLMLTICLLFSVLAIGLSQTTILKIMGKHRYTPPKEGTLVEVQFVENINVCDPVHGYRTLEDMEYSFEKSLKSKGISFKKFTKEENISSLYGKKTEKGTRKSIFHYLCSSKEEVKDVHSSAQINFADKIKVNEKYPDHVFEEEDDRAIGALIDAKRRAEYIAKGLDMEVSEILNIDDITNAGLSSYFSDLMLNYDLGSDAFAARSYGLWVTFELKPI